MRLRLAIIALLVLAAPARAATSPVTGVLVTGPALAGSDVAWIDRPLSEGVATLRLAGTDGAVRTLATLPGCSYEGDLDASVQYVVAKCGDTVVKGLGVPDPAPVCDGYFDLDGSELLMTGCQEGALTVIDLPTGTHTALPITLQGGFRQPVAVRLTAHYVAMVENDVSFATNPGRTRRILSVFDRAAGTRLVEQQITEPEEGFDNSEAELALSPDGVALTATADDVNPFSVRYTWTSPAEPTLHAILGIYAGDRGRARTGLAGGRFAAAAESNRRIGVVTLAGAEESGFATDQIEAGVAFDGARIAWSDSTSVHNEAYPYAPPAPTPSPDPSPSPSPSPPPTPGPAPRVTITTPKRVKQLKALAGSAPGAVRVRLALVRPKRCATLRANGRLRRLAPAKGTCTAAAALRPKGTTAWRFALKRRLPAGRYVLTVVATNGTGATATATRAIRVTR